jgi:hypothetical protein
MFIVMMWAVAKITLSPKSGETSLFHIVYYLSASLHGEVFEFGVWEG